MNQPMEALELANRIRSHRAAVHKQIRCGDMHVVDVLDDPMFQTARLLEVLTWQWQWATARAARLMRELQIGEDRRIGRLTDRQKGLVAIALGQVDRVDVRVRAAA